MPGSTILKLSDPYEYQSAMVRTAAAEFTTVLTAPGNYQSELTLVDLHRVELQHGRISLPRIVRGAFHKNLCGISFQTADKQAPMTINGIEAGGSYIAFCGPGAEYIVNSSTERYWGGISLTPEVLASVSHTLAGYEITAPKATHLIQPPSPLMARLLNVHEAAAKLARLAPDILAHPEVARAIEQELLRALIACLADSATIKEPNSKRQRIMQRFHQVLEASQYEPLYLPEICAAVGTSERTLHSVCTHYLGQSPHRYLWLRRMNLVRRALDLADPEAKTVTTIANDYGFAELGRFSVAYRALFGESPSTTLRCTPDRMA